jgi:hypothetical protein
MPVEPAELAELLELLLDASVEFILVGGAAAVIHGAPVDARLIDPAGRELAPERATLSGPRHSLIRELYPQDRPGDFTSRSLVGNLGCRFHWWE